MKRITAEEFEKKIEALEKDIKELKKGGGKPSPKNYDLMAELEENADPLDPLAERLIREARRVIKTLPKTALQDAGGIAQLLLREIPDMYVTLAMELSATFKKESKADAKK